MSSPMPPPVLRREPVSASRDEDADILDALQARLEEHLSDAERDSLEHDVEEARARRRARVERMRLIEAHREPEEAEPEPEVEPEPEELEEPEELDVPEELEELVEFEELEKLEVLEVPEEREELDVPEELDACVLRRRLSVAVAACLHNLACGCVCLLAR